MQARPERRFLLASVTLAALEVAPAARGQSAPSQPRTVAATQSPARKATKQMPAAERTPRAPEPEAAPLPAAGDEVRSWYLRNEVGGNFIPAIGLADKNLVVAGNSVSWSGASLSMDAGFAWNIAAGWRITDHVSVEVASGLAYNAFSSVTGSISLNGATAAGTTDVSGSLLQVPAMGGLRLELPAARDFWVNLGASVGAMYLNGSLDTTFSDGVTSVRVNGSDGAWAFAYSATLGVEWDLTADVGIGVAYRFIGTTSATFGPLDAIGSQGIYNQNVLATLTLRF